MPDLLQRIERYYDALPRSWGARAEAIGPLTLFVNVSAPWPLYGRPTPGAGAISSADVAAVRARMRQLALAETFEWVHDVTPTLRPAASDAGLVVTTHPLLALTAPVPAPPVTAEIRAVRPDDDLPTVLAAAHVGFAQPGTGRGSAGLAELHSAAADRGDDEVAAERHDLDSDVAVRYAAWVDGAPVCTGRFTPLDGVAEIVGVGTVPAYRRRGLGAAVTAALAGAALGRGVEVAFMSAGDTDVARLYRRLGFADVGTACIAAPAGTAL